MFCLGMKCRNCDAHIACEYLNRQRDSAGVVGDQITLTALLSGQITQSSADDNLFERWRSVTVHLDLALHQLPSTAKPL